jgi:hypothetical protein
MTTLACVRVHGLAPVAGETGVARDRGNTSNTGKRSSRVRGREACWEGAISSSRLSLQRRRQLHRSQCTPGRQADAHPSLTLRAVPPGLAVTVLSDRRRIIR